MKAWLVLGAAMLFGCATPAPEYTVQGTCTGGLAEGAYALVLPDGLAQVTGTFEQGRKNGVFTFLRSSGETVAIIPYRMDLIDGTVTLLYGPEAGAGKRKLEASYVAGALDGPKTSWYPNGVRRTAFHYTGGKLDQARAWGSDGSPLSSADAAALAASDLDADRRYYAVLEDVIRENQPACAEPDPQAPDLTRDR